MLAFITGWFLDLIFGDPTRLPHPIVLFGKMIAAGEHSLNKGKWRRTKGGMMAITLILFVFLATWLLIYGADCLGSIIADTTGIAMTATLPRGIITAICVFYCLAGTTLIREVRWVFLALERSLDDGRRQVARIVGRDTSKLSAQEVRKAALETLAENLSDGVIAPMFWFLLLGVPGMMAYKMVNTLDSMIGYHSERYLHFGMVAARIDDAANYLPARLTAVLMAIVSGKGITRLLSCIWQYGPQHASPNSGYPEAALAGILNCRFGGPHHYFGEYFYKPYIGNNERELNMKDMEIAVRTNRRSEIVMALVVAFIMLCSATASAQTHGTEKDMPLFYNQMKAQLTFPWAWQNNRKMKFDKWKKAARAEVEKTMQIAPPAPATTDYEVIAEEQREGYKAQKILFWVNKWEKVMAYLLVPDNATVGSKAPAALMLHDHGAHFSIGKEKMVRPFDVDSTLMADAEEWAGKCYDNQFFGDEMAKRGYVVLSTDALFWGDRGRQEGVRYDSQQALASNMMQMGGSWGAYITWDDIRSAHFLASLPMVDNRKVGCVGFSMGSYRAWMCAALSDDISISASICWMNDTDHLMTLTNNQNKGGSAYAMLVPSIRQIMDYPDVAALACPKPTLIFNGSRDKLMPVEGVQNCYSKMQEVWHSQKADDNLITKIWDEKHFFNKEMQREVIEFFDRKGPL